MCAVKKKKIPGRMMKGDPRRIAVHRPKDQPVQMRIREEVVNIWVTSTNYKEQK